MGIFDSVAMGFATISPVVGLYAVVLVGMVVAGGAWVWVLPVALAGQCLLLAVYSELAGEVAAGQRRLPVDAPADRPALRLVHRLGRAVRVRRGQHDDRLPRRAVGADAARHHADRARDRDHRRAAGPALLAGQRLRRRRAKVALRLGVAAEAVASVGIGLALLLVFREQRAVGAVRHVRRRGAERRLDLRRAAGRARRRAAGPSSASTRPSPPPRRPRAPPSTSRARSGWRC